MKEKLKNLQEDFRGVSKGAIALICYIEGFIIFALVALLIIYGFTTSLTEKAVSQAIGLNTRLYKSSIKSTKRPTQRIEE